MLKFISARATQLAAVLVMLVLAALVIGDRNAQAASYAPPTSELTITVDISSGNPSATFLFDSPAGGFSLGNGQSHTFAIPHTQVESVTMASAGWSVAVSCTNNVFQGTLGIPDLTPLNVQMFPNTPATCTFVSTELPSGAAYPLTGTPAVNLCPPASYSVLAYASYYDLPVMPGLTGTPGPTTLDGATADDGTTICVQHAPKSTWGAATVADFSQFDLLWIGADACRGDDAGDFVAAVKSRPVWEEAIDPNAIMVFGGDLDVHMRQNDAAAVDIGVDSVQFLSQQQQPGLLLQLGCYSMRSAPWLQELGGIFSGLGTSEEPLHFSTNPNEPHQGHPFVAAFSHEQPADWAFHDGCHGALLIDEGSPAADLGLLRVADFHIGSLYDVCVLATKGN